jgi:hypothetical protein
MAAKRFGQFVSNVQGTSLQIPRVKEDESGFEFYTPANIPAYTITNDSTDRVLDATDTNIDELANVVSTLIKDVTALGVAGASAFSAFQWSTSEQVYPLEKALDGSTLYCKQIDTGALPNNTYKTVAHGISNLNPDVKMHRLEAFGSNSANDMFMGLVGYSLSISIETSNIYIYTNFNAPASGWSSSFVRIIYAK